MNNFQSEILLQWNTCSLIAHWGEFREYLANKKPIIAAIQETRFLDSDLDRYSLAPFGYSLYCQNLDKPRRGGAALYISNNLLHHQITISTELNYVAVNVKLCQREITVVSIYLPPLAEITKQQLENFFDQLPNSYIVMGDFNAHHQAWGCSQNRARGNILHDIIESKDIIYLNDTTPTHHCVRNGEVSFSVIDLTLASPNLADLLTSDVQSDRYFSDHYPIHIKLETPSGQTNFHNLPKWNFKKADWLAFQEHIELNYNVDTEPDIRHLLDTIYNAAKEHIPLVTNSNVNNNNHVIWWNADCHKAAAIRRRALRKFQNNCYNATYEKEARDTQKDMNETINNAKREAWEKYSNNFNRFTSLSKIWSMIKHFKIKRNIDFKIPHLIVGSQHYSTPFEVATKFAAHYASISATDQYSPQLQTLLSNTLETCDFQSSNNEQYNQPFTMYELRFTINKCGNTSMGPDQLHYQFFKNLSEENYQSLLDAYNYIWEGNDYPESFSTSTLIPIPKRKKIKSEPASYRPISLSSCASKIIERMVNSRLKVHLENNNLLSKYQNGFRPRRSTTDSILHILNSIYSGFQKKDVTVALFIDLKAAFDKVHHDALLIKLHKLGIKGKIITYLKNFVKNRTFSVRCGSTYSQPIKQEHGLPQGSPLSPTLFLILINDIFDGIFDISNNFGCSMYADDLAVWFTHPSVDIANRYIQRALNEIQNWCDKWGIEIAPNKSATLIFSNNLVNVTPYTPLRLNNNVIPVVNSFKYLGIVLDRRLTFSAHIDHIKQKCSRRLNLLRSISGTTWGADRKTLLYLYTSLIRPVIEYNAFLFDNISTTQSNRLEVIQNAALRVATGALKTTNTYTMNIETNIPQLASRRKQQLVKYYIRADARPETIPYNIFHEYYNANRILLAQRKYPTYNLQLDYILEDYNHLDIPETLAQPPLREYWNDKPFETILLFDDPKAEYTAIEIQQIFNNFRHDYLAYTFIYTDGSKAQGKTSFAFTSREVTVAKRLTDFHSIYSAELYGIKYALEYLKKENIQKAVICTDSKAATLALNSTQHSDHPILNDIKNIYENMNIELIILWIPGHCGITGNENADQAAKQALTKNIEEELCPATDIINLLKQEFYSLLQKEWEKNPHYHLSTIKPIMGNWISANQDTRKKEIILARLRLGQTRLTHSYYFDQTPPPDCTLCRCRYTIQHFLLFCPRYRQKRQDIIRYINSNGLPLTLKTLLDDSSPTLIEMVFKFLQDTSLARSI